MARVTITLEDTEDGEGFGLTVESDPPFPGPAAKDKTCTPAQFVAHSLLEGMVKAAKGSVSFDEEDEG